MVLAMTACGGGSSDGADPSGAEEATRAQALAADGSVWTNLSDEGKLSYVNTLRMIRYGSGDKWVKKKLSGSVLCSVSTFGSDPAPGVTKTCEIRGNNPHLARLTWTASVDPLVTGYRVYYGTSPGEYIQALGQGVVANAQTSFTISGLDYAPTYYFAVTSVDASGNESVYSNEATKSVE